MKSTLRLLSLLLAMLLCGAVFLTACNNADGNAQSTDDEGAEIKEPKGSYKLRFTPNGDGTCSVTGIEVSEDAENLTLVIPEVSPDGEKVTAYSTDALSFANIPQMISAADFVAHIETPLNQAVENGEISRFVYDRIAKGFFYEKSLENEKTEKAKETLLTNYPLTAATDLYEFAPDASVEECSWVSLVLSKYANYTSLQHFADVKNLWALGEQKGIGPYVKLPIRSDAFIDIILPSTLESISSYAFLACNAAKGNVLENVIYFGNEKDPYLMLHRAADFEITSIDIPKTTKVIGDCALDGCTKLERVSISEGVTKIGNYSFMDCKSLTSVTILGNVTSIGEGAFSGCSGIKTVSIPDLEAWCKIHFKTERSNPLYSGAALYINDVRVTELVFPETLDFISSYAFVGCDNLEKIIIPDGVTEIGDFAFDYYSSSTDFVVIGKGVTKIGKSAFGDFLYPEKVYYNGTAEQWSNVEIDADNSMLGNAMIYYYADSKPTEAGDYWHYVDGIPTAWR